MVAIEKNWFEDANKGTFHSTPETDWVFHKDLGHLYHHPSTNWYFSSKQGLEWLFIHKDHVITKEISNSKAINGFLYSAGLQAWIYVSVADHGDGSTATLYQNTKTKDWKILK